MSNRRVEVLSKYLTNLAHLGFNKDDQKVLGVINEIEKEMGLLVIENQIAPTIKNPNETLVIAIKDITGSVGALENDRFNEYFQLALKEIKQKYSDVTELFITHHTEAAVVGKEEFFVHKGIGGTIVSSALKKLTEHLDTSREIIVVQFSDGDNLTSDCPRCVKLLEEKILSKVKYFKYVEANLHNRHSTLMNSGYQYITKNNFDHLIIKEKDDSLKGVRFGEELQKLG